MPNRFSTKQSIIIDNNDIAESTETLIQEKPNTTNNTPKNI